MIRNETKRITYNYITKHQHSNNLVIYNIGHEQCRSLHSFGPYIRTHYLFHYIHEGTGFLDVYTTDKKLVCTHEIGKNSGFIIFPNVQVKYHTTSNTPWTYTWIEFDGALVQKLISSNGLNMQNPVYTDYCCNGIYLMESIMNTLISNASDTYVRLLGIAYLFFDQLIQTHSTNCLHSLASGSQQNFYILKAVDLIHKNYNKRLTIEYIANELNLNRSYFSKLFTKNIGMNPITYLTELRLEKAVGLLRDPNLSIKSISKEIGYSNQLYFSQVFKHKFKLTPQEFREKSINQKLGNFFTD